MKVIPLTKGHDAIVDDDDYLMLISRGSWHFDRYAKRIERSKSNWRQKRVVYMHKLILPTQPGLVVDHINGNKLDNRKANLRTCMQYENTANRGKTSGMYKGVSWDRSRRKWVAYIGYQYKRINIGRFESAEAAALAYNQVAKQLFGDYATLNELVKEVIE